MRIILPLTFIILTLSMVSNAQNVGISAVGSPAKSSAGLDIDFPDKGLLIPRISLISTTDILTVPNPEPSLLIYNNNSNMVGGGLGFWFWDGVTWKQLNTGKAGGTGWLTTGNAGLTAADFLGTLDNAPLSFYTNNSERLRINANGYFGVGTSNPQRKVHIVENSSGTPSMFALDNINNTNGNGISLSFRGNTTGIGGESFFEFACIRAVYTDHNHATSNSSLTFWTLKDKKIKQTMRINHDGYVGINTTEPTNFLHVFSKDTSNPIRIEGLKPGESTNEIVTINAQGVLKKQGFSTFPAWNLTGNTGLIEANNFIGTTDGVPFNIRVNNEKSGRIDFTGMNTFYGYKSSRTSGGTENTGIGYQALSANAGNKNTAIGSNALVTNTTGSYNIAIGSETMKFNTTGENNTAIGFSALINNLTGSNNLAMGNSALFSNQSGKGNIAIGASALLNNLTGDNNLAIGFSALLSNKFGIGNTAIGTSALHNNLSGNNNLAVGYRALNNNTSGMGNTASGFESLVNNTSGRYNTAVGYRALWLNTTGEYNLANGFDAMVNNKTGHKNIAIGFESMYNTISGDDNIAIGTNALRSANITTLNVAIGSGSLSKNTIGRNNTAIGKGSLLNNVSGSYNTAIGTDAGVITSVTPINNSTAIGKGAQIGVSDGISIGAEGNTNLRVGIGLKKPANFFDVNGSFGAAITVVSNTVTLDAAHYTLIVIENSNLYLPPAVDAPRRTYRIINQTAAPVTISTYIDFTGLSATSIPAQSKIEIQSDGTKWYKVD